MPEIKCMISDIFQTIVFLYLLPKVTRLEAFWKNVDSTKKPTE